MSEAERSERRAITRDAIGIGIACGAYAISFGALTIAAGMTVWHAIALSTLMFTGGSQFGLIGVIAGGGAPLAGAATAIMLGSRNALYGLRMAPILGVTGLRRVLGAQLVIDESTAMSMGRSSPELERWGFWSTGLSVFVFWNLGTVIGAVGSAAIADPRTLGLDAAAPAAFIALLAPRLRHREPWAVAITAALVAVLLTPVLPVGLPILAAALVGFGFALTPGRT